MPKLPELPHVELDVLSVTEAEPPGFLALKRYKLAIVQGALVQMVRNAVAHGRPYFAFGLKVAMMPSPSRTVSIWFAFTCVKRSIFCVVGHFTSMASTVSVFPRPK